MQVKLTAVKAVKKTLEKQQGDLRYQLRTRAYEMNKLAEQQAVDKRQLAVLGDLLYSLPHTAEDKK